MLESVSTLPAVSQVSEDEPGGHFLADLYTFKFSALELRLPLISAAAVALCLFVGVGVGHPGGALIAGGGALTIGFGANQRIADSRLIPMLVGVFAISTATLAGTVAGNRGYLLLLFSGLAAAIYGVLTMRNTGIAWVGQQAAVALFVASAFPGTRNDWMVRGGLMAAGGLVQVVFTSVGLRMLPDLRKDIVSVSRSVYHSLYERRRELLQRLRELPGALPARDQKAALIYAMRLVLTVLLSTELYRRLGIQSGYWIPMTALLVQKPAFFETLSRGLQRVAGTLAGATLATLLARHLQLGPWTLAALAAFFAFWSFATNAVNYGLFSLCLTSYIVFLISLNQLPGPEIAHRRAFCTIAGAGIALGIHLDALRRHREIGV